MVRTWRPLELASLLLPLAAARPHAPPEPPAGLRRRDDPTGTPVSAWYYPGYASNLAPVATLPWEYINMAIYFVAPTTPAGIDASDFASDTQLPLLRSATQERDIPLLMSVGGWDGSMWFSRHVGSEDNRTAFVGEIMAVVEQYEFDGVDIDWEFPNDVGIGCNTVSPDDSANLLTFFTELRAALENSTTTANTTAHHSRDTAPKKYVTAAVGVQGWNGPDNTTTLNDTSPYAAVLDYITIMNYDVYNSQSDTTGPHSPLSSFCQPTDNDFSAEQSVALWTSSGFPAAQLILGIPTYAHGWTADAPTLATDSFTGGGFNVTSQYYQAKQVLAPEGDDSDGKGVDSCGVMENWEGLWLDVNLVSYGFLAEDGVTPGDGWQRVWDNCSSQPFIFNSASSNLTFISYDDAESTAIKAGWAVRSGLAGIGYFDATGPLNATLAAAQQALADPANAPQPVPDLPGNTSAAGNPPQTTANMSQSGAGSRWEWRWSAVAAAGVGLASLGTVL